MKKKSIIKHGGSLAGCATVILMTGSSGSMGQRMGITAGKSGGGYSWDVFSWSFLGLMSH